MRSVACSSVSPASGIGPSSGTLRMPHLSSLYGFRRSTRSRKSSSRLISSGVRCRRACSPALASAGTAPPAAAGRPGTAGCIGNPLVLLAIAPLAALRPPARAARTAGSPATATPCRFPFSRVLLGHARVVRHLLARLHRSRRVRGCTVSGNSSWRSARGRRPVALSFAAAATERFEDGLLLLRRADSGRFRSARRSESARARAGTEVPQQLGTRRYTPAATEGRKTSV